MQKTHRCPHCDAERSLQVPRSKHVIIVATCPDCGEMALMFEGVVLGLRRAVFESGDRKSIGDHIAEIVGQLLDHGVEVVPSTPEPAKRKRRRRPATPVRAAEDSEISQEEVHRFVHFELERIDDADYFRKHFG